MPSIEEIRDNRIKKLEKLKSAGVDAYPLECKRTHAIAQTIKDFTKLKKSKKQVILAGRIMAFRAFGQLSFIKFDDPTGRFQAVLRKEAMGPKAFDFFHETIEVGDFCEFKGEITETKTKEKSIDVQDYRIIAKGIMPMPEKWHGILDLEERYRKRYLDLIFNQEVKDKFAMRSQIISLIREFMGKQGFMEVETPILQPLYGGAKARPFKTHINAFDLDIFLRVAPELYLKRLIIGGYDKVYEIGKAFRNEGVDKYHNPDFTIMESYWAFADYKESMKMTEQMLEFLTKKLFKSTKVQIGDGTIDFKAPWERIEFRDLLQKYAKVDYDLHDAKGLAEQAKRLGVEVEKGAGKAEIADEIYKKFCRPLIINPTFIIHHPLGFQPLAKAKDDKHLANYQVAVAGTEIINAFSELNDPIEQAKRFKEQAELFKQGFSEAQQNDVEFVEALEHGMPPTAGFGMGIDRLIMLLTNSANLRDAILFPLMKPKEK